MRAISTLVFLLSFQTWAQSVDVKDVNAQGDETTTIEIRKGKAAEAVANKNEPLWEITDGSADIEGEPSTMNKEARESWKKACNDWKKEFRADNKENKIISMSCGTPDCSGEAGNKTCTSKATYKVKTKLN